MIAKRYFVSGKVQGVFFRVFTRENAARLKLKGYVKNLFDGRVEVYVEGPAQNLEELHKAIKIGPEHARVENIEIINEKPLETYSDFTIER